MRLDTLLLVSSISFALLCSPAGAQEAKSCCSEAKPQVTSEGLVKDLKAAAAKVRALPKAEKEAAVASLRGAAEACPVARASLQVVTVLKEASDAMEAGGCCAEPAKEAGKDVAKDEGAKARAARFAGMKAVLAAHVELIKELGLPSVRPDCCTKDAKSAKETGAKEPKADSKDAKAAEAGKDCCEGGQDKGCCGEAGIAKFAACAASVTKSCGEIPTKLTALRADEKAKAKVKEGAAVLEKLGVAPAFFAAMGFYAEGLAAAAKECADRPEAGVVKGLAEMTAAFGKGAATCCEGSASTDCCTDGKKGGGCCDGKKVGECCGDQKKTEAQQKKTDIKDC